MIRMALRRFRVEGGEVVCTGSHPKQSSKPSIYKKCSLIWTLLKVVMFSLTVVLYQGCLQKCKKKKRPGNFCGLKPSTSSARELVVPISCRISFFILNASQYNPASSWSECSKFCWLVYNYYSTCGPKITIKSLFENRSLILVSTYCQLETIQYMPVTCLAGNSTVNNP